MLRITNDFQQRLIAALVKDAGCFGLFIAHIEPDYFSEPKARSIVMALQHHWKEYNKPVKDLASLEQQMKRLSDSGVLPIDHVFAMKEYVGQAECGDLEALKRETAESIKSYKRQRVAEELVINLDEEGTVGQAVKELEGIDRIGQEDSDTGLALGDDMFAEISALKRKFRCPTGIPDLDVKLRGGVAKGELLIFCAASGGGKSLALAAMAANAIRVGYNVAFATLELAAAYQGMRILAGLTGIPTNKIESDGTGARERFNFLRDTTGLGSLHVKDFEPTVGTSQEIISWVDKLEKARGERIDLLVVDYLDKLGSMKVRDPRANSYLMQGQAAEDLRYWAMEGEKRWVATASQAKGRDNKKVLEQSDVADSIGKVRVSDLFITINKDKETKEISLYVAKARGGVSDFLVGPYPDGFEYGSLILDQVGFKEERERERRAKQVRF